MIRTTITTALATMAIGAGALVAPATAWAWEPGELESVVTCRMEDGSDVIPAIAGRCMWTDPDTGKVWLTYADRSYPMHGVADTIPGPESGRSFR